MKFYCVTLLILVLACFAHSHPAQEPPQEQENRKVTCNLPVARGHCRALLPRWRYDPATSKCHEFKFGGCDGNGNNFMTEQQCMTTCGGV